MWRVNFPECQEPHPLSFRRFPSLDASRHFWTATEEAAAFLYLWCDQKWLSKGRKSLWGKNSQAWVSGFCPHGESPFSFTEDGMIDGGKRGLSLLELRLWRGSGTPEAIPLVEAIIIKDISRRNEGSLSFRTAEFICPSLLAGSPLHRQPWRSSC